VAGKAITDGLYGAPPRELAERPAGVVQYSPLTPGAEGLETAVLTSMTMLAPAGVIERRYVLALTLRALEPGGRFTVMAPKDKGGSRLRKELEAFGCTVFEDARRHHRICTVEGKAEKIGLDAAIAAGAPRLHEALGLWTQPGIFSWDRIDPGTGLLMATLPALSGRGADFGCGLGVLAHKLLTAPAVESLDLIDIDRRAVEAARRNVSDPRARFHWADIADGEPALDQLDFVVMNPPFHDAGIEDKHLGQQFIRRAGQVLKTGGVCWMVANRHLPYERVLAEHFNKVTVAAEANGFKIFEARK
jgi:16S rRNA (guanine1207-N2)-methyltransferase